MKRSDSPTSEEEDEDENEMTAQQPSGENVGSEAPPSDVQEPQRKRQRVAPAAALKKEGDSDNDSDEEEGEEEENSELRREGEGHDQELKQPNTAAVASIPAAASAPMGQDQAQSQQEHDQNTIVTQTFPQRLVEMLDNKVVPDAMWWAEEGKAFALDLSKFEDVLQTHFQATKYASFTRKLNKWGFRKLNNIEPDASEDVVVYRHELFQQGQPELLSGMSTKRKKQDKKAKDAKRKKKTGDDGEPSESLTGEDTAEEYDSMDQERKEEGKTEQQVPFAFPRPRRSPDAAESKSQDVQHQLSMASSLASTRISARPGFTGGSPLMRSGSAVPSQVQALQQQSLLHNPLQSERDRIQALLASRSAPLPAHNEQLQLQLQLQLQQQQQRRDSLTLEMLAQRQLAASTSSPVARQVDYRLSSIGDPSRHGLYGIGSSAGMLSNLQNTTIRSPLGIRPAALEPSSLGDLAAALRSQQAPHAQANPAVFSPSLNPAISNPPGPQSLGLPDPRAALGQSLTHSLARSTWADTLNSFQLASRGTQASSFLSPITSQQPQGLSDAQLQFLLSQERQALAALAVSASGSAGTSSVARGNPGGSRASLSSQSSSLSDQQLLEMILERQRLEAQYRQQDRQR